MPGLCYNLDGMKRLAWILILSILSFSQSAEEVILRLENRLRSLDTLIADFEHNHFSAFVSTPLKEKGTLYFQPPDKMRWEYREPENNVYLYLGDRFEYYFPEDKQLIRGSLSEEGVRTEILDILAGNRGLGDMYQVEFSSSPSENRKVAHVKLTPRDEGEASSILLEIDRERWLILKALFFDWEGNREEFLFKNTRTDRKLPPDVFSLKVPEDVEIIQR